MTTTRLYPTVRICYPDYTETVTIYPGMDVGAEAHRRVLHTRLASAHGRLAMFAGISVWAQQATEAYGTCLPFPALKDLFLQIASTIHAEMVEIESPLAGVTSEVLRSFYQNRPTGGGTPQKKNPSRGGSKFARSRRRRA
jgi:hypothetical protein